MRTALPRVRLALAFALGAGVLVPLAAGAFTDVLPCGSDRGKPWQTLPVPTFPGVEGVDVVDRIASYAVETDDPRTQLVTNGTTVMVSTNSGCRWRAVQSLEVDPSGTGVSGAVGRITSTAILPSGRALLAVREGSGAISRPRVLGSDAPAQGAFAPSEQGLPVQGAPGPFAVGPDGQRVFLIIRTSGAPSSDETAGPLPIPALPAGVAPSLLYGSNDGGRTWELRSAAAVDGAGEITQLVVDRADPGLLHGIAGGRLVRSTDSGATFAVVDQPGMTDVTAVAAMDPGGVAAFTQPGVVFRSRDGGESFGRAATIAAVTSAAYRAGHRELAVEANGDLYLLDPDLGVAERTFAPAARAGTLAGDTSRTSTFHVVSGHDVLRYSDSARPDGGEMTPPPLPQIGDLPPAPPRPGTVQPARTELQLGPGESRRVDYRLDLPANPTPLDVFFLIDTSPTMRSYISDLKSNITNVTRRLAGSGIDLNVGLGMVTTGPSEGDPPYPEFDPTVDNYEKPPMYRLLRAIGPVDDAFNAALQGIRTETLPSTVRPGEDPPEAQLMALEQLATGKGVRASYGGGLPVYVVPPGQAAGFRAQSTVRRVVVHATDQAFVNPNGRYPAGSPENAEGKLDYEGVIDELVEQEIRQIGVTNGAGESVADLTRIARGTKTVAPPDGADCDGEPIAPGEPLVCPNDGDFGNVLVSVLSDLSDVQPVRVKALGALQAVDALVSTGFEAVDVSRANALSFSVTYSCAGVLPGTYETGAEATLRGTVVGRTTTSLTCLAPPVPVRAAAPAIAPAQQVPVPVAVPVMPAAPAPPAPAQPGAQPNINPLTAAAAEEQQEAQLALALQDAEEQKEQPETTDMAMVSRRREETSATMLLAMAMAGASLLGLARLRADRAVRPATQRARSGR